MEGSLDSLPSQTGKSQENPTNELNSHCNTGISDDTFQTPKKHHVIRNYIIFPCFNDLVSKTCSGSHSLAENK